MAAVTNDHNWVAKNNPDLFSRLCRPQSDRGPEGLKPRGRQGWLPLEALGEGPLPFFSSVRGPVSDFGTPAARPPLVSDSEPPLPLRTLMMTLDSLRRPRILSPLQDS